MRIDANDGVLLVVVATLAVTALADAASRRYDGKVTGAGSVSFRLSGGWVKQFRASVSVTCTSSSGGQSETYLLVADKSSKLDKHGRFTLTYKKDKRPGGPFPLYNVNATVKGQGQQERRERHGDGQLLQEPSGARAARPHRLQQRRCEVEREALLRG